ncbi:MAG TPA: hypothetical protein VGW97_01350 [Chthoniobacterales bacterium]|jgi:hypothetical protein|nr:hypothetical protein [Chthoniobacterales bacterium]
MEIPPQSSDDFLVLGNYSIVDAERLLRAFSNAKIEYQLELDDGSARIDPVSSALGGKFGQAAQATIKVAPLSKDAAEKIHFDLFGDCLPNYESAFFKRDQSD